MTQEINNYLTLIECTLINEEVPDYLEVSYQMDHIYILLSKKDYENYKVHERIEGVMGLLKFEHTDILEKYPVIIECLTSKELDELMDMYKVNL